MQEYASRIDNRAAYYLTKTVLGITAQAAPALYTACPTSTAPDRVASLTVDSSLVFSCIADSTLKQSKF